MLFLFSGLPGSGKTLSLVDHGMRAVKDGKRVFELGIRDLDHDATGILPYPGDFQEWATTLQAGDVLLVDEITKYLPKGLTARSLPKWVEEFTRFRHLGVELYFATQHPQNFDAFVRRLVTQHRHFVNRWGGNVSTVYMWPEVVSDVESRSERGRAEQTKYKYPSKLFGLYKSSDLHVRKKHTPKPIRMLKWGGVAFVLALCLFAYAVHRMHVAPSAAAVSSLASAPRPSIASSPFASLSGSPDTAHVQLTADQFRAQFVPRLPGQLWSEPIYGDLRPQTVPETYCISVDTGACSCISDQGTQVFVDHGTCRTIARYGVYNPFRHQSNDQWNRPDSDAPAPARPDLGHVGRDSLSGSPVLGGRSAGSSLRAPYNPGVFAAH